MKKNFPNTLTKIIFTLFFCCLFSLYVMAQESIRYAKEIYSDNDLVKYEMSYPAYWDATSHLSDDNLTARFATKEGFISVTRNLETKTFLLVLKKTKAESYITKDMFAFKPGEIIPLKIQSK